MLPHDLIDILVCPACKGQLMQPEEETGLLCLSCRLRYPVRNGIPVLLTNEAESIADRPGSENSPCTA
jgi:uncharacterized protein YbaR (Trm112 family)